MTQKPEHNEGVFSRWSRRKLDNQTDDEIEAPLTDIAPSTVIEPENLEEASLPIWLQDDVDPEAKRSALSSLFREPEFNVVDRMNEYDEDFTQFKGLGNIVTQQMKHMLKLAEQKTRPDDSQQLVKSDLSNIEEGDISPFDEQMSQINESKNDNEDNESA